MLWELVVDLEMLVRAVEKLATNLFQQRYTRAGFMLLRFNIVSWSGVPLVALIYFVSTVTDRLKQLFTLLRDIFTAMYGYGSRFLAWIAT